MTDVYFRGEWVDKSLVNLWLNNPENQRILEEEQAKEKAQAEEERKKQRQRQRKLTKPHYEGISQIPEKHLPEWYKEMKLQSENNKENLVIDEHAARLVINYANSAQMYEQENQRSSKEHEVWLRQMEQKEKQDRERKEQEAQRKAEYRKNLPRQA